ncbi:hypothetical protein [Rehaibacterium terrae]|mgnify:CR=1 FL=1|jgi:hypothetical protein|uniref:Secreted protein n=1 Tax=Rehaibacterium terrae TaxID=1341696 RepID=A0A7W7V6T6_9GAMM|nr:hypothetical protein [Rehaibacterium terrae]MBB5014203.1 hypothetical protein [Rehaibacterium terrae]
MRKGLLAGLCLVLAGASFAGFSFANSGKGPPAKAAGAPVVLDAAGKAQGPWLPYVRINEFEYSSGVLLVTPYGGVPVPLVLGGDGLMRPAAVPDDGLVYFAAADCSGTPYPAMGYPMHGSGFSYRIEAGGDAIWLVLRDDTPLPLVPGSVLQPVPGDAPVCLTPEVPGEPVDVYPEIDRIRLDRRGPYRLQY